MEETTGKTLLDKPAVAPKLPKSDFFNRLLNVDRYVYFPIQPTPAQNNSAGSAANTLRIARQPETTHIANVNK